MHVEFAKHGFTDANDFFVSICPQRLIRVANHAVHLLLAIYFEILAGRGPHTLPLNLMADELVVACRAASFSIFAASELTESSSQTVIVLILRTLGAITFVLILSGNRRIDRTSEAAFLSPC